MPKKPQNSKDIDQVIEEISALKGDVEKFRQSIRRIEFAPHEKPGQSEVVGPQHGELIKELEDIADKLDELPKKWGGED